MAALRCLYQRAVDDGLIAEAANPARKVAKPRCETARVSGLGMAAGPGIRLA
ncbi:MAG TPA: hypothetical protein VF838_11930 [Trebonia sp.]